jgi:hypothetical protein
VDGWPAKLTRELERKRQQKLAEHKVLVSCSCPLVGLGSDSIAVNGVQRCNEQGAAFTAQPAGSQAMLRLI